MGFGGFSWKRAIDLSAAKARLSRRIGISFTKNGRQRKLGQLVSGGGCLVVLAVMVAIPISFIFEITWTTGPNQGIVWSSAYDADLRSVVLVP